MTSDRHQGTESSQTESFLHEGVGALPQGSCALLDLRYRDGKTGEALARGAGMPEPVAYTLLARIHRLLDRAVRQEGRKPLRGSFDTRGLPRPSADGEDWLEVLGLRSLDGRTGPEEGAYLSVLCRNDRRRERIEGLSRLDAELRSVLIPGPEAVDPMDPAALVLAEAVIDPISSETVSAPLPVPLVMDQGPAITPEAPARDRSFLAIALGGVAVAGLSLWLVMTFSSRPMAEPSAAGVEMTAAPAVPAPLPEMRTDILPVRPNPAARERIREAFRTMTLTWLTGGRCGMTALSRF